MTTLPDFQVPTISYEEISDNHGRFTIEPLDKGFGYTYGNSLRRVLLSSLEGVAVTSVRIEGVQHEFTSVPGVREDVTDIIIKLRDLVCRLHGEMDEIEVELSKLPQGRTPTLGDWQRISRSMRKAMDARIQLLTRTRAKLEECIGCGCLSLQRCQLYNRDDRAGAAGPGPRYVLD